MLWNYGLDGLQMKFSPGPPEHLSKEQQGQLKQTILHCLPHEVGFTAKFNWTLHMIGDYVKREFGKTYSIRGVYASHGTQLYQANLYIGRR
jgi:transposase